MWRPGSASFSHVGFPLTRYLKPTISASNLSECNRFHCLSTDDDDDYVLRGKHVSHATGMNLPKANCTLLFTSRSKRRFPQYHRMSATAYCHEAMQCNVSPWGGYYDDSYSFARLVLWLAYYARMGQNHAITKISLVKEAHDSRELLAESFLWLI